MRYWMLLKPQPQLIETGSLQQQSIHSAPFNIIIHQMPCSIYVWLSSVSKTYVLRWGRFIVCTSVGQFLWIIKEPSVLIFQNQRTIGLSALGKKSESNNSRSWLISKTLKNQRFSWKTWQRTKDALASSLNFRHVFGEPWSYSKHGSLNFFRTSG